MVDKNQNDVRLVLAEMCATLDTAIAAAIESPAALNTDLVNRMAPLLSCLNERERSPLPLDGSASEEQRALLWAVRSRAGRLQMLLDKAGVFYLSCLASAPVTGLDYDVYGDPRNRSEGGRLRLEA